MICKYFECSGLTSVTIGNSVTSIGRFAFSGCIGLTSIIALNETPISIEYDIFTDKIRTNATLYVPLGSKAAYETADYWKEFKKIVSIKDAFTTSVPFGEGMMDLTFKVTSRAPWEVEVSASPEGISGELTIPATIQDEDGAEYAVTGIGSGAFKEQAGLTAIILPEGLTAIGNNAFEGSGLASISFPESLESIGQEAFKSCDLETITIPEGVTSIGSWAFSYCGNLQSVTLGSSVASIGSGAFYNCSELTSVRVKMVAPVAITSNVFSNRANATLYVPIGSKAAYEAANNWKAFKNIYEIIFFADPNVETLCLTNWDGDSDGNISIDEAAAVTDLGSVFRNNSSITSFDELQYFSGLANIARRAFFNCTGLTSINIPDGVTGVDRQAFYGCSNLVSIYIPESLTSIESSAFVSCSGLTSIIVNEENSEYDSRENCNAIIETATNTLMQGCKNTTIPHTVTSIGNSAFYYCHGLKSINIPEGVTSIGESAFTYCGLTSVTIPESVASIGSYAFENCYGLTSISIPEGVTSIAEGVFSGCSGLRSITIPESVTSIGASAFYNCYRLESITIPEGVTSVANLAFYGCSGLTSVIIPSSLTSIGRNAFGSCGNLTSVTVYVKSPISISSGTFSNRANATLYVPYGSKEAYEEAEYWKEFGNIVEMIFNELYVEETPYILSGNKAELNICLKNDYAVNMTDFYLQLPDGISISKDDYGDPYVTIASSRSDKHVANVQTNGAGYYHIVCYSTKNNAFKENDGLLFTVPLECNNGVAVGNYECQVMSILMSDTDKRSITQPDFSVNIEVPDLQIGDVNNDGHINGLDIVEMVDHIMQRPSDTFFFAAADLHYDKKINGLDLVELVSLVLEQGMTPNGAQAPALGRMPVTKEEGLTLEANDEGLTMGINSADDFILAQCIVEVDEGLQLNNISADSHHVVAWQPIGGKRYAVVAYSTKNGVFDTNMTMLTFDCSGQGNISISDAMLVDTERNERHFTSTGLEFATGLKTIEIEGDGVAYDLQGRKVANSKLPKGTYIVNGKKVVVK